MAWPALTDAQQQAVDVLVSSGRLSVVPADVERARAFIGHAEDPIADLPHLTRTPNRYNLAYDACHDLGEALLAGLAADTAQGLFAALVDTGVGLMGEAPAVGMSRCGESRSRRW